MSASLSARQLEGLIAVAHGVSHQQLASQWGVSRPAVSNVLRHARLRLGAATVTHAVHLATRGGLIPEAACGSVGPAGGVVAPGARRERGGPSGDDGAGFMAPGSPNAAITPDAATRNGP